MTGGYRCDHEPPEDHQQRPADTTHAYISAQVIRWEDTEEHVHPTVAMAIAAWWMSPSERDTSLRRFAQTGHVTIAGRDDDHGYMDLADHVGWLLGQTGTATPAERSATRALVAYVGAVVHEATRYRRSLWHGGGHRWMSTGTIDHDSCLTCGVEAVLRPEVDSDGDCGSYYGGDGELIISCTGRTDLAHGSERHCEGVTGRGCEDWQASMGETCEHVEHECNCLLCHN